jgi:nucleoid DNA-binding protein
MAIEISAYTALETFDALIKRLENNKKVYFIRFGDGEFMMMQQRQHRNHNPSEKLAQETERSFYD